jgi:hypothetical protein
MLIIVRPMIHLAQVDAQVEIRGVLAAERMSAQHARLRERELLVVRLADAHSTADATAWI